MDTNTPEINALESELQHGLSQALSAAVNLQKEHVGKGGGSHMVNHYARISQEITALLVF